MPPIVQIGSQRDAGRERQRAREADTGSEDLLPLFLGSRKAEQPESSEDSESSAGGPSPSEW